MSRTVPLRRLAAEPQSISDSQYLEAQPSAPPLQQLRPRNEVNNEIDTTHTARNTNVTHESIPFIDYTSWPAPSDLPMPWLPAFPDTEHWPTPESVNMPDLFPFPPPFLPPPPFGSLGTGSSDFPWLAPIPFEQDTKASRSSPHTESLQGAKSFAASSDEQARLRYIAEKARRDLAARRGASRSASQSSVESPPSAAAAQVTAKIVSRHREVFRPTLDPHRIKALKDEREARINARRNSVHNVNMRNRPDSSRLRANPADAGYARPTTASMRRTPPRTHSVDNRPLQHPVSRPTTTPKRVHNVSTPGKGVTVTSLKGEIPSLSNAMRFGLASDQRRLSEYTKNGEETLLYHSAAETRSARIGAAQYTPFAELAKKDPRAAEYLRGIETLYNNLRSSYESFQKNPEKFLKDSVPSVHGIDAAVARRTELRVDPSHVTATSPPRLPNPSTIDFAIPNAKVSAETRQLRQELDRLEHQWQALSEIRGEASVSATSPKKEQHQHLSLKPDIFSYESVLSFVKDRKR